MNKREQAQHIADEHGNDAYMVALELVELREENEALKVVKSAFDDPGFADTDFIGEYLKDINRAKAEAVRSFSDALCYSIRYESEGLRGVDEFEEFIDTVTNEYANKLENQND